MLSMVMMVAATAAAACAANTQSSVHEASKLGQQCQFVRVKKVEQTALGCQRPQLLPTMPPISILSSICLVQPYQGVLLFIRCAVLL